MPIDIAPGTGTAQPSGQGPYYPIQGQVIYYWDETVGYARPVTADNPLPVSGGSSGGTASSATLLAGSAIAGKFGIDQTTPGTTNGVSVTNTSLAVTGTFFQATQPVSGTIADSNSAVFSTVTSTLTVGGASVAAGRSIVIVASAAGNVSLQLSGGQALLVPVNIGLNILPFAVTAINTSGTSATATYANLN